MMSPTCVSPLATAVILALSLGCSDSAAPPDIVPKPTRLAFLVAPVREEGSVPFSHAPQVEVLDQFGNTDTTATHPITLTLGADSSGVTLGAAVTVYAVAGVATFPDLSVTVPGSGYVLNAAAPGLTPVVSAAFAVGLTAAMVKAGSAYTCAATTAETASGQRSSPPPCGANPGSSASCAVSTTR